MRTVVVLAAAVLAALAAVWWLQPGPTAPPTATPQVASEHLGDPDAAELPAGDRRAGGDAAIAFVVAVRDQLGQPIAGASVLVQRAGSLVAEASTDRQGEATLPASGEPAELRVSADAFVPVLERVAACAGRHEVVIGDGDVIDGLVLVDGAPPSQPIPIEVMTGDGRRADLTVMTRSSGVFAVYGLPQQWSGRLVFPRCYWLTSHSHSRGWHYSLSLAAPGRGLHIELAQLPVVRARLVSAADGKPLPGRAASFHLHSASESGESTVHGARSDAEGRIEVELGPDTPAGVASLRSRSRGGLRAVEIQVDRQSFAWRGAEIPADLDLGDVRIDLGREAHFLVVDARGAPIEGAVVMAYGRLSAATDASGRTQVNVLSTWPELLCGAIGFEIGPVAARSGTGEVGAPYRIELRPGNLLTIRVRDAEGRVPPAVWVEIELDKRAALFGAAPGLPDSLRYKLGAPAGSLTSRRDGDVATMRLRAQTSGDFLLPGITPEVPLCIRALGRIRSQLAEQRVRTPPATGKMVVDLVVEARRSRIAGRVRAPDGSAATGARVNAWCDGSGPEASVDASGRFAIEDIYAVGQMVMLEVSHPRHAQLLRTIAPLVEDIDLDLTLASACTVDVTVVDASGRPVDGVSVSVRSPRPPPAQKTGPGTFRLQQLAAGPCEIVCTISGQEFTLRHDAAVATAKLVVPVVGRLEVVAPASWARDNEQVTVELSGGGRRHTLYLAAGRGALRHESVMLPGTYEDIVRRAATELDRRRVVIVGGETSQLQLD